jgi:hypothetical protein
MAKKTEWAERTGLKVCKGLSLGRKPQVHESLMFSLTGEVKFYILRGPATFLSFAIVCFLIAMSKLKARSLIIALQIFFQTIR